MLCLLLPIQNSERRERSTGRCFQGAGKIMMVLSCGFPNTYSDDNPYCQDPVVDTMSIVVTDSDGNIKTFEVQICQHHINIFWVAFSQRQIGSMIREGKIRGEWL